jgi:hypothetical protein
LFVQIPPEQYWLVPQTVPQPPQLLLSVFVLVQPLPQFV